MARMPSNRERATPRATRGVASFDPSQGLSLQRRGIVQVGVPEADFSAARQGVAAAAQGFESLGRNIQQASNVLYAREEEERLKDEERAVKNLEVEWSRKRREILFGDGTPEKPGFFSTAGEDTLNGRKGVEDELTKARSQILTKAKNVRVKQAFDLSSANSLQGELEQVDRYTISQRKEANLQTSQAAIEEATQSASTYFSDRNKWNLAVDRIATEFASMGDELGWSQDKINNETQKAISNAAKLRIGHALIQDSGAAASIYADVKGMVDGDARIEIEQDIKAAKKAEETERRLAAAEERQRQQDAADSAFDSYAARILSGEPVSAKEIALDKNLDGRSRFALAGELERKADKAATQAEKTNPTTFNTAFRQIHSGKVTDWHALVPLLGNGLDFQDFNILRGEIEKQDTAEGKQQNELLKSVMDFAEKTLTSRDPNFGIADPEGEKRMQTATVEILKAWDEGIKKGISPYELSDQKSANFVGKIVTTLERPLAERMKSMVDAVNGMDIGAGADAATPGAKPAEQVQGITYRNGVAFPTTPEEKDKLPAGTQYVRPGETQVRTKQ